VLADVDDIFFLLEPVERGFFDMQKRSGLSSFARRLKRICLKFNVAAISRFQKRQRGTLAVASIVLVTTFKHCWFLHLSRNYESLLFFFLLLAYEKHLP
jgi:hypothetical protein